MIDFKKANEVLFVLYSINKQDNELKASKIAIQKILYLSNILLPIKRIALSICNFITYTRGPYDKNIQNILDQLSMFGLIDITDFEKHKTNAKVSYINYKITKNGMEVVEEITKYTYEKEKFDWINLISKTSIHYTIKLKYFDTLDGIVKLVYQDPSFLAAKNTPRNIERININEFPQTKELIDICVNRFSNMGISQKQLFELVVYTIFEFYYLKYLDEHDA